MDRRRRLPPALEDLPELYADLIAYLEKLEGAIKQLRAQATAATLNRVTRRDLEPIQNDIERLKEKLELGGE